MPIKKLFLGAGAMKAGTTWLYSLLAKHPSLYFSPEKEVHFLSDFYLGTDYLRQAKRFAKFTSFVDKQEDGMSISPRFKQELKWWHHYSAASNRDFSFYEGLFRFCPDDSWACDFCNLSCHLESHHWEDLVTRVDDLKVLYVLRDPMSRLWSHIKFHQKFAHANTNFDEWSKDDFASLINKPFIWKNSQYAINLQQILNGVGEDTVKVMFLEELSSSPNAQLNEILTYIGLTEFRFSEENYSKKVNATATITMPSNFLEVAEPLITAERQRIKPLLATLPPSWDL